MTTKTRLTEEQTTLLIRWATALGINTKELTMRILAAALDGDKYIEKAPADTDPYERNRKYVASLRPGARVFTGSK